MNPVANDNSRMTMETLPSENDSGRCALAASHGSTVAGGGGAPLDRNASSCSWVILLARNALPKRVAAHHTSSRPAYFTALRSVLLESAQHRGIQRSQLIPFLCLMGP